MDADAPDDDLHNHPTFDFHVHRVGGRLRATVWLYGRRFELVEVGNTDPKPAE